MHIRQRGRASGRALAHSSPTCRATIARSIGIRCRGHSPGDCRALRRPMLSRSLGRAVGSISRGTLSRDCLPPIAGRVPDKEGEPLLFITLQSAVHLPLIGRSSPNNHPFSFSAQKHNLSPPAFIFFLSIFLGINLGREIISFSVSF